MAARPAPRAGELSPTAAAPRTATSTCRLPVAPTAELPTSPAPELHREVSPSPARATHQAHGGRPAAPATSTEDPLPSAAPVTQPLPRVPVAQAQRSVALAP